MTDAISSLIADIASTYATDTIFILGKGPSVDRIDPRSLSEALVIGLNDAERIAPVDVSLFHDGWAAESVADNGFKSRAYVTSTPMTARNRTVVRLDHAPVDPASPDGMMQRFQAGQLLIEDTLFITALQIARRVASARGRPQTVYMVGLDFQYDADHAYSERIGADFSRAIDAERRRVFGRQEEVFLCALNVLKETDLDVRHVGFKRFSALTPEDLDRILARGERDLSVAPGVAVVAELTTNHFGDRPRLERMIRASRAAGADYVKLQKRDVETFYSREQLAAPYASPFGRTFGDYRRQLELDRDDFHFVAGLCAELGLGWFASVLDEPSFDAIAELEPAMIKLPSTISEHRDFLAAVATSYEGTLVVSTGMTDQAYEDWVLNTFTRCERLVLMQANSAYPTKADDCNIGVVRHYHDLSRTDSRIVPGYSSHDHGWLASALAVAAGARMVEKHVKLGNTDWAHFDAVAVDLSTPDFKDYVDHVRQAERIVGQDTKQITAGENHKYRPVTVG